MADQKKSLAAKLAHVMTQVKYIQKNGFNSFHKYKYATEADVQDAVRSHLAEQNVIMLPSVKSHEIRETTTMKGVVEYIACVDMEFVFVDGDSGEQFTVMMSGEGQDRGDKAMYKAISGTQKYALMKTFQIPTGDDPERDTEDNSNNHTSTPQNAPKPPTDEITPAQKKSIKAAIDAVAMKPETFVELVNKATKRKFTDRVEAFNHLTKEDADKVIEAIADYKPEEGKASA